MEETHDIDLFFRRKGCWICQCPKYKFYKKMTREERERETATNERQNPNEVDSQ